MTGKSTGIPNRRGIEERLKEANTCEKAGHWKGDTLKGHYHAGVMASINKSKTKLRLAYQLARKTASAVALAIIQIFGEFKFKVQQNQRANLI